MENGRRVYCTECENGSNLIQSILFGNENDFPETCKNCFSFNPEDSAPIEERPNYIPAQNLYRLVDVVKKNLKENFDRASIIDDIFIIDKIPEVGQHFSALHGSKRLMTTRVKNIVAEENCLEIETENTKYKFVKI